MIIEKGRIQVPLPLCTTPVHYMSHPELYYTSSSNPFIFPAHTASRMGTSLDSLELRNSREHPQAGHATTSSNDSRYFALQKGWFSERPIKDVGRFAPIGELPRPNHNILDVPEHADQDQRGSYARHQKMKQSSQFPVRSFEHVGHCQKSRIQTGSAASVGPSLG